MNQARASMGSEIKQFYDLPWTNLDQQIDILKSRGCKIPDNDKFKAWIKFVGFMRLDGYLQQFEDGQVDKYIDQLNIDHVIELYDWDDRLKNICLEGARTIEISVRTSMAHIMGDGAKNSGGGAFAHLNPKSYDSDKYRRAVNKINKMERAWRKKNESCGSDHALDRLKEGFKSCVGDDLCPSCIILKGVGGWKVKHEPYPCKTPTPIWVSIECWDLGATQLIYSALQKKVKKEVANYLRVKDEGDIAELLEIVRCIRNRAAHHERLFGRKMQHEVSKAFECDIGFCFDRIEDSLFTHLSIMCSFLNRHPNGFGNVEDWKMGLKNHLSNYPDISEEMKEKGSLQHLLGAPENWESLPFWK